VSESRHRTQGKGEQRRDWRGDADIGRGHRFAPVANAHQNRDREDCGGEKKLVVGTTELNSDSAEQSNHAEGADAGDAAAFGKLAIFPSALEAHQQADREGDRQPAEQVCVFGCHVAPVI
jgi:hypothetical protein